jgi:hypothetical protein
LIAQQMQMLQEVMQQMRAAKLQAAISEQEYEKNGSTQQQKLINQVLQQMIMDQGLLVQGQN